MKLESGYLIKFQELRVDLLKSSAFFPRNANVPFDNSGVRAVSEKRSSSSTKLTDCSTSEAADFFRKKSATSANLVLRSRSLKSSANHKTAIKAKDRQRTATPDSEPAQLCLPNNTAIKQGRYFGPAALAKWEETLKTDDEAGGNQTHSFH